MTITIQKHLFTLLDYHHLTNIPLFQEDDRIELIEGEVIDMSPIGTQHAATVKRITQLLYAQVGSLAIISVQDPIQLDDFSEPQPDIALLRHQADFYAHAHPTKRDILLLIEVADSSVQYDREVKIPLYARHGIPEVWLVDLLTQRIEVFLQPSQHGYQNQFRATAGQLLVPTGMTQLNILVEQILPT